MAKLLNSTELSEYLKVTQQTVYNWRKQGMPTIKLGTQYRYEIDKVLEWLEERK